VRYDPNIHHRRSVRLKGWDYSSSGAYEENPENITNQKAGAASSAPTLKQDTPEKKKHTVIYNDLDHLAGTWDKKDYREFQKNAGDFEKIDEDMWK